MQQFLTLWNAFELRRKIIVALAVAGTIGAVLLMTRAATTPNMTLLYAGLDPAAAGEVITALEQRGIAYSVQGDAIYVDGSKRDQSRMALAQEGLPKGGGAGYELLDDLNGFGTTAQMFDAAYWRAKEGELARTILVIPQVRAARVHLANQQSRPFARNPDPSASVTLTLDGGPLGRAQANALRFLVASAVPGLSPENVSIIDSERGLISQQDEIGGTGQASVREQAMRKGIQRMLEAHVGQGNAVVEVAIETDRDQETLVERRFDPEGRVAISTDTEEVADSSSDNGNSDVTVASNLPDGDADGAGESSRTSSSETRERINYEVSETTRETLIRPGRIKRISVAVLVNGRAGIDASGVASWQPRSAEDLAAIRELVESASGFNADRGDIVTIKSLEFQPLAAEGTLVSASPFAAVFANMATLLQSLVLALVALGLGLFVVRPALQQQALAAPTTPDIALGAPAMQNALPPGELPEFGQLEPMAFDTAPMIEDPVEQLRQIIAERQEDSVEILKNWIEASEEAA